MTFSVHNYNRNGDVIDIANAVIKYDNNPFIWVVTAQIARNIRRRNNDGKKQAV